MVSAFVFEILKTMCISMLLFLTVGCKGKQNASSEQVSVVKPPASTIAKPEATPETSKNGKEVEKEKTKSEVKQKSAKSSKSKKAKKKEAEDDGGYENCADMTPEELKKIADGAKDKK